MKQEFKKGDEVTFHPYKTVKVKAIVVKFEPYGFDREKRYWLEGVTERLNVITSPSSIIESEYYIKPERE